MTFDIGSIIIAVHFYINISSPMHVLDLVFSNYVATLAQNIDTLRSSLQIVPRVCTSRAFICFHLLRHHEYMQINTIIFLIDKNKEKRNIDNTKLN